MWHRAPHFVEQLLARMTGGKVSFTLPLHALIPKSAVNGETVIPGMYEKERHRLEAVYYVRW